MPALNTLRGLIFDLDGTLVHSALDFAAMRRETGCPEGTGLLEYIASLPCPEEQHRAESIVHRHEMAGARRARWMPGAREALARVCASSLRTGIVTRNSHQASAHMLEMLNAPALELISREQARPKPDPEGLLLLADRWRLPAGQIAYVGDFHFDLQAAASAGMHSILYLQDRNEAYAGEADYVLEHFNQLPTLLGLR